MHIVSQGVKKPLRDSYVIVGDDIVFFCESLMLKAKELYSVIDIEIQDLKSKVPVTRDDGTTDLFTEFCSRSSVNNIDVSRLSPVLIRNASHDWRDIPALIINAKKRGITLDLSLIESTLINQSGNSLVNLSKLKSVLTYPVMGQDLTEYSEMLTAEKLPNAPES